MENLVSNFNDSTYHSFENISQRNRHYHAPRTNRLGLLWKQLYNKIFITNLNLLLLDPCWQICTWKTKLSQTGTIIKTRWIFAQISVVKLKENLASIWRYFKTWKLKPCDYDRKTLTIKQITIKIYKWYKSIVKTNSQINHVKTVSRAING